MVCLSMELIKNRTLWILDSFSDITTTISPFGPWEYTFKFQKLMINFLPNESKLWEQCDFDLSDQSSNFQVLFKRTHTVYFSISFYNINQKLTVKPYILATI